MPSYLLTYRFGRVGDYGARAEDFVLNLQAGDWWGETGSTVIVHSDEPIDDFCYRVLSPPNFDENADICVVVDLDNREGRAAGRIRDTSLFLAAPWIRRY